MCLLCQTRHTLTYFRNRPLKAVANRCIHLSEKPWKLLTMVADLSKITIREDVKILTYKPHTNHKRSSVRAQTLAPTSICDLSHSLCGSPLTDLGHISSVTYVCHPLWFVCGHRKGILTSPLTNLPKTSIGPILQLVWP